MALNCINRINGLDLTGNMYILRAIAKFERIAKFPWENGPSRRQRLQTDEFICELIRNCIASRA